MLSTEFNPVQQPLLNEKVLRDKRKKLRETFDRIVRLYERENPETYKELRKLELDYETKRGQLALYFDSVKVCHFSACLHYKSVFDDGMQYLITNNLSYVLLECRVCRSGQHPFTRHASCPFQHPHSRHPTPRGSATLHSEEKLHLWVDFHLRSDEVFVRTVTKRFS